MIGGRRACVTPLTNHLDIAVGVLFSRLERQPSSCRVAWRFEPSYPQRYQQFLWITFFLPLLCTFMILPRNIELQRSSCLLSKSGPAFNRIGQQSVGSIGIFV
jgi:hypothetical protein